MRMTSALATTVIVDTLIEYYYDNSHSTYQADGIVPSEHSGGEVERSDNANNTKWVPVLNKEVTGACVNEN